MPVILAGILLSAEGFAQDCGHETSAYCDTSWRGFAEFSGFLKPYSVEWKSAFEDSDSTVEILTDASHIPSEVLQEKLSKGARMLILDESDTTLELYRETINRAALAMDSPFLPEAYHINGNRHLPVFQVSEKMKESFGLPEESLQWRLAFNHPTPIGYLKDQNKPGYAFAFAIKDERSQGAIFVLRDESLMTKLMLGTYDNGRFLSALIASLCMGEASCRIALYEPSAKANMPEIAEDSSSSPDEIDEIAGMIRNARERFKALNTSHFQKLPWKLILMILFATWIFIAMASAFNWGRSKPE